MNKTGKGGFWKLVATLLQQQIWKTKPYQNCSERMKNLAAERRVLIAIYKEESGTVQPVTEMTQIMDRWLEVLDNKAEAAKV